MPDFLKEPQIEKSPSETSGAGALPSAPSALPNAQRSVTATATGENVEMPSEPLLSESEGDSPLVVAESSGVKSVVTPRKAPPAIFTHYYGAFFLLLVGLFFGGGYFFLAPTYRAMTVTAADIVALNGSRDAEQAYLDALNRSITAAEGIPKDVLDRIGEALPREHFGIPKLLVTMSEIARQSGVSLGSIQFSPGVPPPATGDPRQPVIVPTKISTNVQTNGYQAMRRFLANLEGSLRLIDVDSISVSGGGAESGESSGVTYSYALQLTAYDLQAPAPPSAPVQEAPLEGAP